MTIEVTIEGHCLGHFERSMSGVTVKRLVFFKVLSPRLSRGHLSLSQVDKGVTVMGVTGHC